MTLRIKQHLPYAILLLAVLIAYGNVYDNAFLLDDEFLILKNRYLRFWGTLPKLLTSCSTAGFGGTDSFYRPLQGLLYFLIYQTNGLSLFSFHALNVALHAANACLVFTLGRRLGFDKAAVFVAALLWAVHPVHTEAVTYISATADPLYALFCLAGLCVLLPDFSRWRMAGGSFLFALALLAKETAIIFPLLAMLCLFLTNSQRWNPRLYLKTLPLWLVAGAYIVLRFTVLHMDDVQFYKDANPYSNNLAARLYTFLATLPVYARLLVWPSDLHMMRNFPVFISFWYGPVLLGAFMMLSAAVTIAFTLASRGTKAMTLSWGFCWFAAAHLLHTGVLLPVNALLYEHWLYLPAAGLFLGIAQSAAMWMKRSPILSGGPLPVGQAFLLALVTTSALALGVTTWSQNKMWHDPIVFYETIINYGEKGMNVYNNLGMAYVERGDLPRAIEHYRAAIALADTFAQPHHNLARALVNLPDANRHIPEAIAELEKAIAINPDFFQSYVFLAEIYERLGDKKKAQTYVDKADAILEGR